MCLNVGVAIVGAALHTFCIMHKLGERCTVQRSEEWWWTHDERTYRGRCRCCSAVRVPRQRLTTPNTVRWTGPSECHRTLTAWRASSQELPQPCCHPHRILAARPSDAPAQRASSPAQHSYNFETLNGARADLALAVRPMVRYSYGSR